MPTNGGFEPPDMAALIDRYNAAPQADLSGLSPIQLEALLVGDWRTRGAVRLNQALTLEQANRPWAFRAAVAFLRLVRDEGPAPVTATGNLSRKFVARALEALDFPAAELAKIRRYHKVINEPDVGRLLRLRHALVGAGYLRRQRGFRITALGRKALDSAAARPGAMFSRLFLARMGVGAPWLAQEGLPFRSLLGPALFLLSRHAARWVEMVELDRRLLIPSLVAHTTHYQRAALAYQWVVAPCLDFGLLEEHMGERMDPWLVRVTPLFATFLTFRFGESRGRGGLELVR